MKYNEVHLNEVHLDGVQGGTTQRNVMQYKTRNAMQYKAMAYNASTTYRNWYKTTFLQGTSTTSAVT